GDCCERRSPRTKPSARVSGQPAWNQAADRGGEQNGPCGFLGEKISGDRKRISKVSRGTWAGSAGVCSSVSKKRGQRCEHELAFGRVRPYGGQENEMASRSERARSARFVGAAKRRCRSSAAVLRAGCLSIRRAPHHRRSNRDRKAEGGGRACFFACEQDFESSID